MATDQLTVDRLLARVVMSLFNSSEVAFLSMYTSPLTDEYLY